MSLTWSNILATVAVCLSAIGGIWAAPKLGAIRRHFIALNLWGIPFVIGQYAQQDEWGPMWVQYHLLDLSYAPWGTAALALGLLAVASFFGKSMSSEMICAMSLGAITIAGYITEVWDTVWAWHGGASFVSAVDMGDYQAITLGVVVAAGLHLWLQRPALMEVAS